MSRPMQAKGPHQGDDVTLRFKAASAAVALALSVAACSAQAESGSQASPAPSASASAAVSEPALRPEGTILFLRTTGNDQHAY